MTDAAMMTTEIPLRYHRTLRAWGWLGCPPTGYNSAAYPPLLQDVTPAGSGGSGSGGGEGGVIPVYRPPLWQNAKR